MNALAATGVVPAIALLTVVILAGGVVVYGLGQGRWPFWESVYLAMNAVSTVGFRELDGMAEVPHAYLATALIVLAGLGSVAYFQSSLTAILVQGLIGERFRLRRMQKRIEELTGHVVVAGCGATGLHVIEELWATNTPFVVIDTDRQALEHISHDVADGEMLYVVGDATEDGVLLRAGIKRCGSVVAALMEDKFNLYVTLSARTLNASARIVTKVIGHDAAPKMLRAGANATVSPNMIGGRRMASEIVRPTVVEFLDQMMRDKQTTLRFEEAPIPEGTCFVGRPLGEVPLREAGNLLVVALRVGGKFVYNPEPSTELEAGYVLVILGESDEVARLRQLMSKPGAAVRPAAGAGANG